MLHPKGNIAELLLREGFAKCVDWSIALATCGPEILRTAERLLIYLLLVVHWLIHQFLNSGFGCFVFYISVNVLVF